MSTLGGTSGSWVTSKGRLRRLAALALVASATVAVNPLSDAAQAASGDFSVDFTAAAPDSYNHLTGGGAFDDRTVGVGNDIVESLEGGDFTCGDVVTYLAQVVVDDTQSAGDDAPQTIELDFSFLADTTGQSGVAIGEFVDVRVNYGAIEDLIAGENLVDDGISDDGGSVATLTAETLAGPLFASGSELRGTVELTDLERNEKVVVRIDVKLFCDPGSNPTGNLQGQLDAGRLTFIDDATLVDPAQALSGGAQTIPFKQIGNIASPAIAVDKTVTTENGACPGVETLTVQAGDTVKYCYIVSNAGEAPLYGVDLVDDNGTPGDAGDDFAVTLTGLEDADLDGDADDLVAGNSATGEALIQLATAGIVVNTATATGDDSIIQPTTLTASDIAEVIIDRTTATLTVDKTWVDAQVGDQVEISIGVPGPVTGTSRADAANETDADVATATVLTGDTITLDESFSPSAAAANYAQTLTCVYGQQDASIPVTNGRITVPAAAADSTIRCSFENARKSATLTLEKAWVGGAATDEARLTIDGTNDDSDTAIADGSVGTQVSTQTSSATVFAGESVVLTEVLGVGNTADYASELTCGGTLVTPLTNLSGTYTVPSDPQAITCRFTNTAARGTIVIVKHAEGGAGTFDYTGDWADVLPGGDFQITTTGAGSTTTGSVTYSGLLAGSYAVAETNPQPAWDLASLVCRDSDATGTASSPNPSAPQLGGAIELDAGETVTCTYNNTKRGSVTIVKDVTNTTNGLSSNVFDFGGDLGIFTLTDAGTPGDNTTTFDNLVAGEYTVRETDANANGFSLDSIDCGNAATVATTDGVTITLGVAESVTCTFVNKAEGNLSITKTAAAGQPLVVDADTFSVTYDLVVTNNGPGATTYDLADTPDFGTGATITEVAVSSAQLAGSPVIDPADPIVSGEPIPGGGTSHTYTVVITFDVAPTMTKTARTCDATTAGRGTFNSATITFTGGTASDNDCVTIPDPMPTISKIVTASQPVAVDGDTFAAEYDIVVTNPGPGQTTYTLSDTPDFGPGASITGIEVEFPDTTTLALSIAGGTIVTDDPIDGGASETYTVTVTFDVAATMTSTDRRCLIGTPDRGAYNAARITFPGGNASDNDCASIPDPNITTTKSVVAAPTQPVQVGLGFQYTVDYTVTVTNGGDGLGTYTLADAPSFGTGTTIDSIELVAPVPASANGAFGLGDLAIVDTAATLLPSETETFTVRATFTVAGETAADQRDCTIDSDPGTGTFNSVTVTPNIGDPDSDDACAPIPDPDIDVTKAVASGPTYDPTTDSYTISYDVLVTNSGSGSGTYDLVETPTFGGGTTITSVTLDAAPVGPPIVNPLVDDQPIAAGGTDTYVVTIGFTVDGSTTSTARDCTLQPGEGGTGTLNTVTVTPNIGAPDDGSDCGQIPSPGIGVVKTAPAAPIQVGVANRYTVGYTITVTNTGPAAGTYTLVDEPKFGAGVTLESVELVAPVPTAVNPSFGLGDLTIVGSPGASLLAGASDEFTIRATFTVDPATTIDQRDCTLGADPGTGTFNEVTVTPNIGDPSTDDDCRPIPNPDIDVEKTATTGPTYNSVADTYSISYDVIVTNAGNGPGTYDLVETPTFGGGTTITKLTVDSVQIPGSPLVDPANPMVDDEPISAGATHNYLVTIEFTVDGDTVTAVRDCTLDPNEDGTGTLNTVTVTPNIGDPDDGSDCEPIGDPQIEIIKTLTTNPAPIAAGSSTWTATYELQIDNRGGFGGSYDLTDDTGFATGLTVTDQQATSSDIVIDGDFTDAVTNTTIATGVAIGPGERDLVTVLVTFEYASQVDPADRVCGADPGPGAATYNAATVTPNIGPASSDDACGPVPGPDVSVDKTVSSGPFDNLDGTFSIVYAIEVANADTAGAGQYDLVDVPTFSPGLIIDSQAVANSVPGTIATDATFPTSGAIVTGQTILPGATHSYEVTVVATLEVDTTTTYEECSSTTGTAGEGLFNRASLTVDGETTIDDVCEDTAGDLMIEKSDGDIELSIGDGPFEYQLKVTNVGGASTGSPVIVTDVLPVEFRWVDFPDTAGDLPFCTQADQVLTCEIDSTLVDAGGESTAFLVSAEARDGIAESIDGYENLSYVDSPGDPAPSSPSCGPPADVEAASSNTLVVDIPTSTNNVACDRTPVLPSGEVPIVPPTTAPPTTTPPPPPTVPPGGLPRTGSDGSMNTLSLAALLLGLGVGLTLVVRRRQQQA